MKREALQKVQLVTRAVFDRRVVQAYEDIAKEQLPDESKQKKRFQIDKLEIVLLRVMARYEDVARKIEQGDSNLPSTHLRFISACSEQENR